MINTWKKFNEEKDSQLNERELIQNVKDQISSWTSNKNKEISDEYKDNIVNL